MAGGTCRYHPAPVINFNDLPEEVLEHLPIEG